MAYNDTRVEAGAKRFRVSRVATVAEEVALLFGTVAAKLVLVFAPVFAGLIDSALTRMGLASPVLSEPVGSALTDMRAWVLGFSLLWYVLVTLWWILHYPIDPEHHDFEWYAMHVGLAALGLYAWALVPAVVSIFVAVFPAGIG